MTACCFGSYASGAFLPGHAAQWRVSVGANIAHSIVRAFPPRLSAADLRTAARGALVRFRCAGVDVLAWRDVRGLPQNAAKPCANQRVAGWDTFGAAAAHLCIPSAYACGVGIGARAYPTGGDRAARGQAASRTLRKALRAHCCEHCARLAEESARCGRRFR